MFALAVGMSLFHLYVGAFGVLPSFLLRILHFLLAALILFLPSLRPVRDGRASRLDAPGSAALLLILAGSMGYMLWNYHYLEQVRFAYGTPLTLVQKALGVGLVLVVLEATRRMLGAWFTGLVVLFLGYPFLGPYLPGLFKHQGFSLGIVLDTLVYTTDGIFGIALGVSATFLVLFIIFGAFLERTGFDALLTNLASGTVGQRRGGPAQMAVVLSATFGMVSGSAVANVLTTGSVTIPTMKRLGYNREFAGAVEAAASTGGQFTPPILGAQAFLMAQFTGIPYITIVRYSILPALLFYLGLAIGIDLEAKRLRLRGLSRQDIPSDWARQTLRRSHLLLPMALLVYLLIDGYTPIFAATYSIAGLVLVSLLRRETRLTLRRALEALRAGAETTVSVAMACTSAGIIVGIVTLTDLGVRFSGALLSVAADSQAIALLIAMLTSMILGMGLPTIPAYIVQLSLVIPALVKVGLPLYIAHLFVIYYSCLSMITPPVALAAYAAAGLAGGDTMKTGWLATRLAAVAYLVPFMFAYNPELLLIGSPLGIARVLVVGCVSVFALAIATIGYFLVPVSWWERCMLIAAAILTVNPSVAAYGAAAVLLALALLVQWSKARRGHPVPASEKIKA